MAGRIGIFGFGNVLMGDDGWGPFVVALLQSRYEMPPGVTAADAGTPGLGLSGEFSDLDVLIALDTVKVDGPPGEIRCFEKRALLDVPPGIRTSQHDPNLKEALLQANLIGSGPEQVWLIGVIPETVEMRLGMTDAVQRAAEDAAGLVVDLLASLGAEASERPRPLRLETWWLDGEGDA
jgi:hydrogenase maturation protease